MSLIKTGDAKKDLIVNLKNIARKMEQYIDQYPAQYMWFYKIWKHAKHATVVILNDGRTGHLRQSQAIAQLVMKILTERGISSHLEVVDLMFKSPAKKRFFLSLMLFSLRTIERKKISLLKWFLDKKSFIELMSLKSDYVISCGSSVAGINTVVSKEHSAKSIVIQRPGVTQFKNFDLIVLPEHDRSSFWDRDPHVVYTKLAPNLITSEYLQNQSQSLQEKFPQLKKEANLTIGFLLGGDSKTHCITSRQIEVVNAGLESVLEQLDARLIITTSRRTNSAVEHIVERQWQDHARCPLLVLATRNNIPEAVGGLLGLADIVVVTSDSISMVSEAVSAGKSVIVVSALRRFPNKITKHERFVEGLKVGGHVVLCSEQRLGSCLLEIAQTTVSCQPVHDQEHLDQAIRSKI